MVVSVFRNEQEVGLAMKTHRQLGIMVGGGIVVVVGRGMYNQPAKTHTPTPTSIICVYLSCTDILNADEARMATSSCSGDAGWWP